MKTVSTLSIVQRALFLMELEQFQGVSSEELAHIAAKMVEVRFEAGETIGDEDGVEERMFVVIEGEVWHKRNGIVIRKAKPGMAFGIFGLLGLHDPDPEVLEVAQPTHTMTLSREDFLDAVSDSPAFATGFIRSLGKVLMAFGKRIEALELNRSNLQGSTR